VLLCLTETSIAWEQGYPAVSKKRKELIISVKLVNIEDLKLIDKFEKRNLYTVGNSVMKRKAK
jgi:hypothetical protein